jgi:hypothetical protein
VESIADSVGLRERFLDDALHAEGGAVARVRAAILAASLEHEIAFDQADLAERKNELATLQSV